MAQIIDPLPSSDPDVVPEVALCCYVNATSKIQIARITNVPDWYFERVVFPGQRLMFEALKTALLEIHTGMMASSILSDTIPCKRLLMDTEVLPTDPMFVGTSANSSAVSDSSANASPSGSVVASSPAMPVGG